VNVKLIIKPKKKIRLQLCDEYSKYQVFEVFPEYFESVDAWIHEFSELGVWRAIQRVEGLPKKIMKRGIKAYKSTDYLVRARAARA
jgi:hypothetical protein